MFEFRNISFQKSTELPDIIELLIDLRFRHCQFQKYH